MTEGAAEIAAAQKDGAGHFARDSPAASFFAVRVSPWLIPPLSPYGPAPGGCRRAGRRTVSLSRYRWSSSSPSGPGRCSKSVCWSRSSCPSSNTGWQTLPIVCGCVLASQGLRYSSWRASIPRPSPALGQQDLYILVGHPEMEIALVVQIAGFGTLAQRAGKTSQRDIEPVSPALRQLLCRPIPAVLQQVKDLFAQVRSPVEQGRKKISEGSPV